MWMQQVGLSLKVFAVSPCVCGKGGYFQQQSAEGSSMTQRGQSPQWEHCGWLCFVKPARATESADSLAVLI